MVAAALFAAATIHLQVMAIANITAVEIDQRPLAMAVSLVALTVVLVQVHRVPLHPVLFRVPDRLHQNG